VDDNSVSNISRVLGKTWENNLFRFDMLVLWIELLLLVLRGSHVLKDGLTSIQMVVGS
jgi:hypothetical protein